MSEDAEERFIPDEALLPLIRSIGSELERRQLLPRDSSSAAQHHSQMPLGVASPCSHTPLSCFLQNKVFGE